MARVYYDHIDPGLLWDKYDYKPLTGERIRKHATGFKHKADCAVGGKTGAGYLATAVWGKRVLVHRLIWAWVCGELPPDGMHVHHVDEDRTNNAWNNLQVLTPAQHKAIHAGRKHV